ncbi:hypothetical protein GCM10009718_15650 [Isoptericola halotolerans]
MLERDQGGGVVLGRLERHGNPGGVFGGAPRVPGEGERAWLVALDDRSPDGGLPVGAGLEEAVAVVPDRASGPEAAESLERPPRAEFSDEEGVGGGRVDGDDTTTAP